MNRDILIEKLKTDIIEGRVVIIAGTGVSVAACRNQEVTAHKVATWTGLLKHGIQYCRSIGIADDKAVALLGMQIDSGETDFLINAAETISQRMRAKSDGVFRGWLTDSIGKLKLKNRAVIDALAALPGILATLNYDQLIEDATGRHAVTWQKPHDVQEVLRGVDINAVLHLHGWFKEPDSVVLGLSSYLAVKDHPHAKAVMDLFTLDRTLLFVGCGDTVLDPNFARLVEWGREALKDVAPRHYLLCRMSEIGAFQTKLSNAPWIQALSYGETHEDLTPFLRALAPATPTTARKRSFASVGHGFDLDAYRQAMRKRYTRLKLEELDPTSHDVQPLTLTGMFIAQSAKECAEFIPRVFELPKELQRRLREAGEIESGEFDEETLQQHRRAYIEQSPRPILEIVNDPAFSRLVILGDPGSGKSTLLQYLLLAWAEHAPADSSWETLPLMIELREYARLRHDGEADGFLSYLHGGASVRWHFDREQLDAWLKRNTCVILFDGLDEIFDPILRRETSTAIHRFADTYPLARVVVTSRVIGYQHQAWGDEGFRHFMLQELDETQISDFLARWHRSAYEETIKGESKRSLLVRAIEDSSAIRELAGNPLLLTMMAIINRTQDLPRDRAELYEQCARLLLHQWKVDLAFATDPELVKASLDYKDKRSLLLSVARTMQSSERGLAGNLIEESDLEATLAEGLKNVPGLRSDRAARALIEQLRGRNFMLCSIGGSSYAFVHRTFLEYFCAVEIRARFETEQSITIEQLKTCVFGHWQDETWHEVLCLLSGMIAPRFVAEILEWLLAQPDLDDTCQHIFVAARCVGEVRKRAGLGVWEASVRNRTQALIEFDLGHTYKPWDDDAQIVSGIRTRAIDTIAAIWPDLSETHVLLKTCTQSDENGDICMHAVEALARGWRDDSDTLQWLKARAQFEENEYARASTVEILARVCKDDANTLPIVKACAQSDENEFVRASAMEALARSWKDNPEVLPIIKAGAQSDESEAVRASATEALARGWKDDPDTLPIIKACVQSYATNYIRRGLLEILVRGWKDDPDTLPIVKACAQSDEDEDVRASALEALARVWKDDPETFPTVKACTKFDENEFVRASAAEVLVRGWKEDPDTFRIVKTHTSDESGYVRSSALELLARGWKDNPDTLQIIKTTAQSDADYYVRQTALGILVRSWKDNPDTLPWIKTRAQSDESEDVRASAVEMLARAWRDDPDTLPWLKACAQSNEHDDVRASAMDALARGWKNDPETATILKACIQSDESENSRAHAVEALVRGWRNDPDTLPILKAHARSDEHDEARANAMEALARGWKNDPDTLPILKSCAKSKVNGSARNRALEALVRNWKTDPDILPILKKCAQFDENNNLREMAVRALGRGWKNDPDTLSILKLHAQSDENEDVRVSAMLALVRGWKNDPDTLSILKSRAQSDENEDVRASAMRALVRGWKNDPDTLSILKSHAQSDENEDVRTSAMRALVRDWTSNPDTLLILKSHAQSDANEDIRASSVGTLASGWKNDPDTLPILQERAQIDESKSVRARAKGALMRGWRNNPQVREFLANLTQ